MPPRGGRPKRRERLRLLEIEAGRMASKNASEMVYGALRRGETVVAVDARWELERLTVAVWAWEKAEIRQQAQRARVTLGEIARENLLAGRGLEPPGPAPPVRLRPPRWRGKGGGPYAKREITVQPAGPQPAEVRVDDPARPGAGTGDGGASA